MRITLQKLQASIITLSAFLTVISCFSSCANKSVGGVNMASHWEMLGSRTVDFVGDKDVIPVSDRNSYSQLRFKIEGRGTTLREMVVTYADGSTQELSGINAVMAPGQFSRTIDLPGAARRITRVEFRHGPGTGGSGKGMMRIFGYKIEKPATATP